MALRSAIFLGIHRMYMDKWFTGIIYLLTFGLFGFGYLYDFWTLNDQITIINIMDKTDVPSTARLGRRAAELGR